MAWVGSRATLASLCVGLGLALGCGGKDSVPVPEKAEFEPVKPPTSEQPAEPDSEPSRAEARRKAAKAVPCARRKECMVLGKCTTDPSDDVTSSGCIIGEADCAKSALCKDLGWCTRASVKHVPPNTWCVDEATAAEMNDGRPWLQAEINLADPRDRGASNELFPALWKQITPIRSCMRDGAVAIEDTRYLVIATIVVDGRGRAKKSTVRRYEPEQAAMDDCIERLLRSMVFEDVPASETKVEFDFDTVLADYPAGMPSKLQRRLRE